MKSPFKLRLAKRAGSARLEIVAPEELPFWGAAYAASADAYVSLEARGRVKAALLVAKPGRDIAAVAGDFQNEYQSQRRRWAAARQNQALRADRLGQALEEASRAGAPKKDAPRALSAEQKAEIERLLAEAESAPKDPLGVAVPWSEARKKK